jgi:hypothetical protein
MYYATHLLSKKSLYQTSFLDNNYPTYYQKTTFSPLFSLPPTTPFDASNTVNKGVQNYRYNSSMPGKKLPINTTLATALRRLELCSYAVQEIHTELEQPIDPEEKADLILATEKLVAETFDLYQTVRLYVWGEEEDTEERDD